MNSADDLVPEAAVNGRDSAVKRAAAELTATEGASLNQFIATAVAEKAGSLRVADDFLRERAATAKPNHLLEYLRRARKLHRTPTARRRAAIDKAPLITLTDTITIGPPWKLPPTKVLLARCRAACVRNA